MSGLFLEMRYFCYLAKAARPAPALPGRQAEIQRRADELKEQRKKEEDHRAALVRTAWLLCSAADGSRVIVLLQP